MSIEKTSKHCKYCERRVMAERPGTNHILHILLSLLTLGVWVPIWLLSSIKFGGWRCTSCGGKV